jgi:hypothetical protein
MTRECHPASDSVSPAEASKAGDAVEPFVQADYCASKGGCAVFPVGTQDFFDFRVLGNIAKFIAFLKVNNPSVDVTALAAQFLLPDSGLKIPDIMTHQPPDRFEFYEIKPNSTSGRAEGLKKVLALTAFCGLNKLPYVAGLRYNPDSFIPIFIQHVGFTDVEITLHFFKGGPGLILWEICSEAKEKTFPEFLRILVPQIILLAILAIAEALATPVPKPVPAP